jgi:hypothetical protein
MCVRLLLIIASLIAINTMVWPNVSLAQNGGCGSSGGLEGRVVHAAAIIRGHVSELVVVPSASPRFEGSSRETRAKFRAEEYLKGSGPGTLDLLAGGLPVFDDPNTGSAELDGWLFHRDAVGRSFVLFFTPDIPFDTDPGVCGGSFALEGAEAEQELGQVRALIAAGLPASGGPPADASLSALPVAVLAIGSFLLAAGALLRRQRQCE